MTRTSCIREHPRASFAHIFTRIMYEENNLARAIAHQTAREEAARMK